MRIGDHVHEWVEINGGFGEYGYWNAKERRMLSD
jgi:hypothetical protein